jgi:hypothetical protein
MIVYGKNIVEVVHFIFLCVTRLAIMNVSGAFQRKVGANGAL